MKNIVNRKVLPLSKHLTNGGFSTAELIVVMAVIIIMSAISVPYLLSYRKVLRSEEQAIKLMDLLRETEQLAMTRRRTMRLEIDLTDNKIKIIDENNTNPDKMIKSIPLDNAGDVRVDVKPNGVTKPNPPNYNDAAYGVDSTGHLEGSTTVLGHNVWAVRFTRAGQAVNTTGTPISANLYVWPPATGGSLTPRNMKEVRLITLFGGSGAVRYWKHNGTTFVAN